MTVRIDLVHDNRPTRSARMWSARPMNPEPMPHHPTVTVHRGVWHTLANLCHLVGIPAGVSRGRHYIGRPDPVTNPAVLAMPTALTLRESQVLAGIAAGLTLQEIADELGVSHDTVSTHAARVRHKLGARDRAHTVAIAYETGLLRPGAVPAPSAGYATARRTRAAEQTARDAAGVA